MCPAGAEPEGPQQQSAEQPAQRDAQVVTVGTGESRGHDPIQHGPRAARVRPRKGPGLHLSMYRELVTADDAAGVPRRKSGGTSEGSEP
ncbi:hypothetical protein GCM10010448_55170 [Streptomyces glomeratus]|uniref:Uncharacterized protein n=1 Tax=Streptomyces glomeratus TaxID=284452 RepID=A0ABP6LWV4_9ACTN